MPGARSNTLKIAILLAVIAGLGRQSAPAAAPDELETVLAQMDRGAANFKSAQADFDQELFAQVTGETETQKGQIHFHRSEKGMDVAVEIYGQGPRKSGARKIVFKDGKARMYQSGIDQITEYESGKNKSDIEAFISLGFGGNRHDLLRNYEVKFEGWETMDKARVARLELIPRQQRMRGMFSRILLWLDPERDVLLKQQLFEVSKDYRLARYSNIRLNSKLPEGVFSLPHAKTVVKAQ